MQFIYQIDDNDSNEMIVEGSSYEYALFCIAKTVLVMLDVFVAFDGLLRR